MSERMTDDEVDELCRVYAGFERVIAELRSARAEAKALRELAGECAEALPLIGWGSWTSNKTSDLHERILTALGRAT